MGHASGGVTISSSASYAPLVRELTAACRTQCCAPITEKIGGNTGSVLARIATGSGGNILIVDRHTLETTKSSVQFSRTESLGQTPLVVIWKKGLSVDSPDDLTSRAFHSIAIPDPRATVYGRASMEWVNSHYFTSTRLRSKLLHVATEPLVVNHVANGQAEAGLVNLNTALSNLHKLGGMIIINDGYTPIELVAAIVEGHQDDEGIEGFLQCLKTNPIRLVMARAGIVPPPH